MSQTSKYPDEKRFAMHFRNLVLTCVLLSASLSGTFALSQSRPAHSAPPQHGDFFAGFSYVSNDASFTSRDVGAVYGWKTGVDLKAYDWLAVDAEFGMGYGHVTNVTSTTYTFLVGPRVFLPLHRAPRLRPFADALIGGTHDAIAKSPDSRNSDSSLTAVLEGGIDYRLAKRLGWRGQFGYLYSKGITHINDEVQNVSNPPAWHVAFSTGPVFRF